MKVLGKTKDIRTSTNVIYAQIEVNEYLDLVGEKFDEFEIQRKREKHIGYSRMEKDIKDGALLPAITLALKPKSVDKILNLLDKDSKDEEICEILKESNQVYILDGFQRTYLLNDLKKNGYIFKEGQKLLLEFWVEKEPKHLIYRLIVLNSGQKQMTLRHQLELLFMTMQQRLLSEIEGIELYKEIDETKRYKPRQYSFFHLVTSYYCFQTKNPTTEIDNLIKDRLAAENILYAEEEEFNKDFNIFKKYLSLYADIDKKCYKIYENSKPSSNKNWLATDTVMNSFFAAISNYGKNEERYARIDEAIKQLIDSTEEDILGLAMFNNILTNKKEKGNIGLVTRKLLKAGFEEFFRNRGENNLTQCWLTEN